MAQKHAVALLLALLNSRVFRVPGAVVHVIVGVDRGRCRIKPRYRKQQYRQQYRRQTKVQDKPRHQLIPFARCNSRT